MRQLLDVMDEAIQLPLRIHLLLASQGKAVEPFVMPKVSEYRLHRRKASSVAGFPFLAIDSSLHPVGIALFLCPGVAPKEADLTYLGLVGCPQALVTLIARNTIAQGAGELG